MTTKDRQLVIIGAGETAQIAYEYFTYDSPHNVVAFAVQKEYIEQTSLYDLPIIPFEEITDIYPPSQFEAYVAISYTKLNRIRARLYQMTKAKGYTLANYISSHAFVWRNVTLGDNVFIFENNVIQHHVHIGNDVILWSGNHIGHRTTIGDHSYLSSHVVVSGFCNIGSYTFLGVNATLNDNITIEKDCIIGSGAVMTKNTNEGQVWVGNPARPLSGKTSYQTFNVDKDLI